MGRRSASARPVKWTADRSRSVSSPTRMAAITSPMPRWRSTRTARSSALRVQDDRQSRRLYVDLLVVGADLSLCHAAVGPVRRSRRSIARWTRSTPTPRRSTPIAARAGRKRPSWSSGWSKSARARLGIDPAELRRTNFVKSFPHQTPVIMAYDAGDYDASLEEGDGDGRLQGLRQAQARGGAARQAARHRLSRPISRPAASRRRRRSARSAPAWACGNPPKCASTRPASVEVLTGSHSHGQGHETTFAQLVSERLGIRSTMSSIVHGDTDKVQFGMGTYGSRSGAVGMSAIVKALDKVEAKAKKVAAHLLEAAEGDIEFKDGKFTVEGTDKSAAWGDVALQAYVAHKFSGQEIEPGLKEGAFYDPTNFTFPAGCHICEVEIDPETGDTEIVELDRGRRFRHRHQSDDRRRPGAWRHRARRRPGAAGARGLRQGRPARDRLAHGLLHAARRRPAVLQGRHDGDASARPIRSASRAAARRARSRRPPR